MISNIAVLMYSLFILSDAIVEDDDDDKYRLDEVEVVVPRDALIQWQVVELEE
jgi:hypothetical protein